MARRCTGRREKPWRRPAGRTRRTSARPRSSGRCWRAPPSTTSSRRSTASPRSAACWATRRRLSGRCTSRGRTARPRRPGWPSGCSASTACAPAASPVPTSRVRERIAVDGEPLPADRFVATFNDVMPYIDLVDARRRRPLELLRDVVAMAYAAFADAPVDVAAVEVGMGGAWDATNVADAPVAVVTPIAVDHARFLGDIAEAIAVRRRGSSSPARSRCSPSSARGGGGPGPPVRRGGGAAAARGRRVRGRRRGSPSAASC